MAEVCKLLVRWNALRQVERKSGGLGPAAPTMYDG